MNTRAGGVVVAHPLFQTEGGGSNPTSALDLRFVEISVETAVDLNLRWHSRVPVIENPYGGVCYGASFNDCYYASAIWTMPIAANRLTDGFQCLELRRMAICSDAPKNTASRMIGFMVRDLKKMRPDIIKLISYQDTDVHEGTIYKASGWTLAANCKNTPWNTKTRTRSKQVATGDKIRWEKRLR